MTDISAQIDPLMEAEYAVKWLQNLLGKSLRIHLTDGRMMCGTFKCTDSTCFLPSGMLCGVVLIAVCLDRRNLILVSPLSTREDKIKSVVDAAFGSQTRTSIGKLA